MTDRTKELESRWKALIIHTMHKDKDLFEVLNYGMNINQENARNKTLEEVEKNYIKKEDWIKQGLALIPVDSMIYIDDEIKFLKRICKVDNTDYRAIMDRIQQLTKLKEKEQ